MLTQLQVSELTADLAQALVLIDKISNAVRSAPAGHYRMTRKWARRATKQIAELVVFLQEEAEEDARDRSPTGRLPRTPELQNIPAVHEALRYEPKLDVDYAAVERRIMERIKK